MANKRLTENGKNFIRRVATYFNGQKGGSRSLIEGNNGKMVNSNSPSDKIWVANVINKYTNKVISNNNELAEYLIQLYDEYSAQYAVDANVIAAQGFQESEFRVWVYNNVNSTASGIPQILMKTVYDIIYTYKWLSTDEKNALIKDMEYPERKTSWIDVVGDNEQTAADKERQTRNHPILHQNMNR